MRIPSKLPQFEKENILILVTGFQMADFHMAGNGEIRKLKSIRVPRRKYSDDEGYFASRSRTGKKRSGVVVSGAVREYPKQAILQEFLKLLEPELKTIYKKEKISSICLFSPNYAMNEVISAFPTALKNKIKFSIKGNFSHYTMTALLEKLDLKRKKLID